MPGFTDLLGSLVQSGLSPSGQSRVTHALEGGSGGSLTDLIGSIGSMMGGGQSGSGGLGDQIGDVLSGSGANKTTYSTGLRQPL